MQVKNYVHRVECHNSTTAASTTNHLRQEDCSGEAVHTQCILPAVEVHFGRFCSQLYGVIRDVFTRQIRRHDEYGVFTFNRFAFAVC